ncbi:MAG: zf-HC2 domain-containing protein [Oscillospiraceae bacterium]|nr:zf-HC2 domain-containing protein [Oscillospiraceae bacterium]
MRNECNIIRDILPLYIENMVNADTAAFVNEHLENCAVCREELENLKNPDSSEKIDFDTKENDAAHLKAFKKKWYRQLNLIIAVCVFATAFVTWVGTYLSLRIASTQETWVGNATFEFDGGSFINAILIFFVFAIVFGAVQMLLSGKVRNALIKYLPTAVTVVGLLFCLVTYMGIFGTGSPSVAAENQYFAMFLCIPVGGAFVGSLLGILLSKVTGRDISSNKQRR